MTKQEKKQKEVEIHCACAREELLVPLDPAKMPEAAHRPVKRKATESATDQKKG